MGANTGLASDPRQRQMAREGMQRQEDRMRQRKDQRMQMQEGLMRQRRQMQEDLMRQRGAGIAFGPGRAMRVPPADSPEYQQMLERIRRG